MVRDVECNGGVWRRQPFAALDDVLAKRMRQPVKETTLLLAAIQPEFRLRLRYQVITALCDFRGRWISEFEGKSVVVEYEPDADLRDTEQVPLLEEGGIEAFIRREVLPYTPDAWVNNDATKIGYEVSFTRHFYMPQPLRTLAEISADILAIEKEAEGLLDGLLVEETQP